MISSLHVYTEIQDQFCKQNNWKCSHSFSSPRFLSASISTLRRLSVLWCCSSARSLSSCLSEASTLCLLLIWPERNVHTMLSGINLKTASSCPVHSWNGAHPPLPPCLILWPTCLNGWWHFWGEKVVLLQIISQGIIKLRSSYPPCFPVIPTTDILWTNFSLFKMTHVVLTLMIHWLTTNCSVFHFAVAMLEVISLYFPIQYTVFPAISNWWHTTWFS